MTAPLPRLTVAPPAARGLNRIEAARYIGVGATTFDKLVTEKKMPAAKHIGRRKIWDVRELDQAFEAIDSDGEDPNEWDAA